MKLKRKNEFITVKDHSVSGESFKLLLNEELGLLETFPQPSSKELPDYYKSDDYISHTDSKRNWFEKTYHVIRAVSLKRKLQLVNSFNSVGNNILDVGCGTGDFLDLCQNNGWNVYGIEPNAQARKIANEKTNCRVYNAEQLFRFKNERFDIITLWHVLEHLPKLEDHILILKSLLKPDGRILVAVPNYKSYDAKYYKEYWAAYDVPRHLWHFSQTSIKKLFSKVDMIIEKTLPLKFDAYYVSLLSEKYKSGWMNIFRASFIGALSNLKAKSSSEYSSLIYQLKNN